jgi:hypothetical protein
MGNAARTFLRWERNRGRNGNDLPGDLLQDQVAEAFNVLIGDSAVASKRRGASAQAFTGDTFSGYAALARFIAGQDDTAAQLFIVSRDATTKVLRVTGGSAATNLTLISAILATRPQDCSTATINGKLYIAIRLASNVNRMLVYDPGYSTTAIRYAGLATAAAPSVANTGAGAYAATLRYYKVAWREKRSGVLIREGLYSSATSFTPSGAGTAARVTKPAATSPAEGETHWVVAGSADGLAFYELSEIVVGTTTYDDSAAPSTYSSGTAIALAGANTPLHAGKFVISTGDRLIIYGANEPSLSATTPGSMAVKDGRVYWTPVLDASGLHDDERISNTTDIQGWTDVSRNRGSEDRALCGPLDGQAFVFQSSGITILVPTGDDDAPYHKRTLSHTLGAVNNQSTFIGEDENGAPCIYWLDPLRGPHRYGHGGVQWCGYDVKDLWNTVNLSATGIAAFGHYDPNRKRCVWEIATGSSNDPDKILTFYVQEGRPTRDADGVVGVRYGWARETVPSSGARCIVMFPTTFGDESTAARRLGPDHGQRHDVSGLRDGTGMAART